MPYIPVPKDLTKVKSKVLFNLTKRQLVCFGGGGAYWGPVIFPAQRAAGEFVGSYLHDRRHDAVLFACAV